MNRKTLILINPECHQGKGWKRWISVKNEVVKSLESPWTEFVLEPGVNLSATLPDLLRDGHYKFIISAGGDGTMHYLVNSLLKSSTINIQNFSLGAIGLGSSNDFLKPFSRKINDIPIRIDLLSAIEKHDVGLAQYYDESSQYNNSFFVVNASFGVTALANWNFNNPGKLLKFLKSNFTNTAIFYTAFNTILRYKNFHCRLNFNNNEVDVAASNINILKKPFVSGSFWYDEKIKADDGKLQLCVCKDMDRIELLKILSQLRKGRFKLGKKTTSETIHLFQLTSAQPVVFECDGETSITREVRISIVPKAINVLSC